jgi:hypothetical protein
MACLAQAEGVIAMLTSQELQIAVVEELINLRKCGISQLDVLNPSGQPKLSVPLLERAAQRFLDGRSGLTRSEAIAELLRNKIELVPNLEHRLWLPVSLGVKEELPTTDPKELNRIASDMARHSSPNDFKRTGGKLQRAFQVLAAQIVNECLVAEEVGKPSSQAIPSINTSCSDVRAAEAAYVPRRSLEAEFRALVEQGANLIAFVGLPGIGKTWLACNLTSTPDGAQAPRIRFEIGERQDIVGSLENVNIETVRSIQEAEGEYLAKLICGEKAPPFVVLDNLQDTSDLRRILPSHQRSTIVATCRTAQDVPHGCRVIRVGHMEEAEALSLIQRQLPRATPGEAELLAAQLHGYPLVISYACGLLTNPGLNIVQFCADLAKDIACVASDARTEEGRTLQAVLMRSMALLQEAQPLALEVLRWLALSPLFPMDQRVLRRLVEKSSGQSMSEVQFAKAVAALHSLALVEFTYFTPGDEDWPDLQALSDGFGKRTSSASEPVIAIYSGKMPRDCLTTHPVTRVATSAYADGPLNARLLRPLDN